MNGTSALAKLYDFRKDDPDEFAIPERDYKGESARALFRAPPSWVTEVSEILAKRMFPYVNASHLYRHALWRHLLWMRDKDSRLAEAISWMEAFMNNTKSSEKRRQYGDMIAYMDREVDALVRAGDHLGARRLVFKQLRLVVSSGAGDTTWKRKATKHITNKHAELLRGGASLDPEEFEKE